MVTRRSTALHRLPPHVPRIGRLALALFVFVVLAGTTRPDKPPTMSMFCIDVGQADSTLLEFSCGAILIDAGADSEHRGAVAAFLEDFFARRSDLHSTLASIIITHSHIDHTSELRSVVEKFTVQRVLDNGDRDSSGKANLLWLQNEGAEKYHVAFRTVNEEDIENAPRYAGLTNADIDPLACPDCDPQVHILSASLGEDPGWPSGAFENENNHSLVIRVDFGQSSFLFTGDLEEPAIERLVAEYAPSHELDVDVFHVGHHGSHNGTTDSLLRAMTPQIAVISMGYWSFGEKPDGSAKAFTTYAYGHPRIQTLDRLQRSIPGYRSKEASIMAARGARNYQQYAVKKRVYATGWEGTVKIDATADRHYKTTFTGRAP